MSNWRSSFTFNKYSQIAARALRQSLKETERVSAEKRGNTILRYQEWKNGQAGQLVRLVFRLRRPLYLPSGLLSLHRHIFTSLHYPLLLWCSWA
ncbi:hypothetical protein PHLCEN_2v2412 [Hermanssonia centrifuga]|uniref:Uncharacterized protein n=1 Tax=Hermanssonia centrifuga TaxID=98765 RepID=A0A2R6RM25_9APHY|nr:hypothetical protein PHLCEN_2v2412 [Hermanssonia centrifuga]